MQGRVSPTSELDQQPPAIGDSATAASSRCSFRMAYRLLRTQRPAARQLRALEWLLLRLFTYADARSHRVLLPEENFESLLELLCAGVSCPSAITAESLYGEVLAEALGCQNYGAFQEKGLLQRARAIKYSLGRAYCCKDSVRASVRTLVLLERLVTDPGFSRNPLLELEEWTGGRLPVEWLVEDSLPRESNRPTGPRGAESAGDEIDMVMSFAPSPAERARAMELPAAFLEQTHQNSDPIPLLPPPVVGAARSQPARRSLEGAGARAERKTPLVLELLADPRSGEVLEDPPEPAACGCVEASLETAQAPTPVGVEDDLTLPPSAESLCSQPSGAAPSQPLPSGLEFLRTLPENAHADPAASRESSPPSQPTSTPEDSSVKGLLETYATASPEEALRLLLSELEALTSRQRSALEASRRGDSAPQLPLARKRDAPKEALSDGTTLPQDRRRELRAPGSASSDRGQEGDGGTQAMAKRRPSLGPRTADVGGSIGTAGSLHKPRLEKGQPGEEPRSLRGASAGATPWAPLEAKGESDRTLKEKAPLPSKRIEAVARPPGREKGSLHAGPEPQPKPAAPPWAPRRSLPSILDERASPPKKRPGPPPPPELSLGSSLGSSQGASSKERTDRLELMPGDETQGVAADSPLLLPSRPPVRSPKERETSSLHAEGGFELSLQPMSLDPAPKTWAGGHRSPAPPAFSAPSSSLPSDGSRGGSPGRTETTRSEFSRAETSHPEAPRPESARPESARPESTRPESTRPVSTRPEAARPEAARAETGLHSSQARPSQRSASTPSARRAGKLPRPRESQPLPPLGLLERLGLSLTALAFLIASLMATRMAMDPFEMPVKDASRYRAYYLSEESLHPYLSSVRRVGPTFLFTTGPDYPSLTAADQRGLVTHLAENLVSGSIEEVVLVNDKGAVCGTGRSNGLVLMVGELTQAKKKR